MNLRAFHRYATLRQDKLTGIDFGPTQMQNLASAEPSTRSRPPACEALVHRIEDAMTARLLDAASTRPWRKSGRVVTLLGLADAIVNAEARRVVVVARDGAPLRWPAAATMDIGAPLSDWRWVDAIVAAWSAEIDEARGRGVFNGCTPDALDWVTRRIKNAVRRHPLLRASRERICSELGLPAELVRLSYRSRIDFSLVGFTAAHATRVWRWEHAFRAVERESPALMRLLAAAIEARLVHDPTRRDLVAQIKSHLRGRGWSQRFWRLVTHCDGDLFVPALRMRGRTPALEVIAQYGLTLDRAGASSPPHPSVADALLRSQGSVLYRADFSSDWCGVPDGLLRLALHEAARRRGELQHFLQHEFHPFLNWAGSSHEANALSQQSPNWKRVIRQQALWDESQAVQKSGLRWRSALRTVQIGSHEARPLCSAMELLEEGRAMRHCIGTRRDIADKCSRGLWRVFSVLHTFDGRRRATITLQSAGSNSVYEVGEVRGRANRAVAPEVQAIAQRVCALYNVAVSHDRHTATQSNDVFSGNPRAEPPENTVAAAWRKCVWG